jgi:predicted NBD/HSP70 family sugar kinase
VPERPGSLEALRQLNRLRILQTLRHRGGASRADVARETGLSRTTVSTLVAALLDEGVVVERPDRMPSAPSRGSGRPATMLTLNPAAGGVVGIDFGHEDIRVGVADLSCTLLTERRYKLDVDDEAGKALDAAAEMANAAIAEAGLERARIAGVGVALSAPVGSRSRKLAWPTVFPGWFGLDVEEELQRRLALPVHVGNDANLGALAEATFGAGRGVNDLVYVMLTSGVGAGLVLAGRLYEGDAGTAGELGHVVVEPGGLVCRCGGRGCLETVAGAAAIVRPLTHSHGPDLTLADVVALADAGDVGAQRVLADAGRAVGRSLAGICVVLNPRLVVVGGGIASTCEFLLEGIRETLRRDTSPLVDPPPVVRSRLSERAEMLGAISLALTNTSVHLPPALAALADDHTPDAAGARMTS